MQKTGNRDTFQRIATQLKGFKDIVSSLAQSVNSRTLQRRLTILVQEGHVCIQGKARARKYYLPISQDEFLRKKPSKEAVLILSSDSLKIQSAVSLPIESRKKSRLQKGISR